jgi:ATP-dependent helicase/nuclease subunit A
MPPADLVDLVLAESAYAYELRGPRFLQARENLKKIRSLLRRMQNRGYATLARLAAHLDRLAVGDEANAAIDALDAVNLMTVHASKGLEFPVVFLVNLSRGTGSRRDPIRVVADPSGQAGGVAIGDFQSEADDDHPAKEREETKRLLYVALTRARDRLYLGSVLKDSRVQPGRGSLAEVLPQSLLDRLVGSAEAVEWRATAGQVHHFRVCQAGEPQDAGAGGGFEAIPGGTTPSGETDDLTALVDAAVPPRSVAAVMAEAATPASRRGFAFEPDASGRLVGTVVHRLLQRLGFVPSEGTTVTRETVLRMLRPEEVAAVSAERTVVELADDVLQAYDALCSRPDIQAIYLSGDRFHEVPFTMWLDGVVLRGTIDCAIRDATGRVTLLEFKTGRPRDEHQIQLDLYRKAAERLFPGAAIDARLVYATRAR